MTSIEDLFARIMSMDKTKPSQHPIESLEILSTLNAILQKEPEDPDALQAKIVCLIQLCNYDQALEILTSKPALKGCVFEKAYCLYRLNRNTEAMEILEKTGNPKKEFRTTQLRAQVLWRLGRYSESEFYNAAAWAQHTLPPTQHTYP